MHRTPPRCCTARVYSIWGGGLRGGGPTCGGQRRWPAQWGGLGRGLDAGAATGPLWRPRRSLKKPAVAPKATRPVSGGCQGRAGGHKGSPRPRHAAAEDTESWRAVRRELRNRWAWLCVLPIDQAEGRAGAPAAARYGGRASRRAVGSPARTAVIGSCGRRWACRVDLIPTGAQAPRLHHQNQDPPPRPPPRPAVCRTPQCASPGIDL